jgi:hypothetical protein
LPPSTGVLRGHPQLGAFPDAAGSLVSLGTHKFGHLRAPEAVVASAGPDEVAFTNPAECAREGPWSFEIASDRSIWLLDELDKRLLVWAPGHPSASPCVVGLSESFLPVDFALGRGDVLRHHRQ